MSPPVYRSVLTWSALCVGAGLLALSTRAAEDAGAKPAEMPSVAKAANAATHAQPAERTAVDEALDKLVTLKYADVPLKDVAAAIGDLAGINVLIDDKRFSDAKVEPDAKISFSCEHLPLHVAAQIYRCNPTWAM